MDDNGLFDTCVGQHNRNMDRCVNRLMGMHERRYVTRDSESVANALWPRAGRTRAYDPSGSIESPQLLQVLYLSPRTLVHMLEYAGPTPPLLVMM